VHDIEGIVCLRFRRSCGVDVLALPLVLRVWLSVPPDWVISPVSVVILAASDCLVVVNVVATVA
jgi:hypothetical protein